MRLDLFTPIHKGLRRNLFETAIALGRTDFSSLEELAAAKAAVSTCLGFLRDHADHEDRHVVPALARLAPELAAVIQAEHPELERAAIAVDSLWPRFAPLAPEERHALGGELARRFQALVAMHLGHMEREEREVNAAFWAAMGDADIAALGDRIVADIAPARMQIWNEIMLPAMSGPERAAVKARQAAARAA